MSYTEITLLNYWISAGMPLDLTVTDERIPEEIQVLLQEAYALETKKKPFYEKGEVFPVSEETLATLRSQGFKVETLAEGNNFLQVEARDSLTLGKVESLVAVKDQITWLDLGNTGLKDEWLSIVAQFPNLTRLNLDNNPITDAGIKHLGEFQHLESINLHSTAVGDSGLRILLNQKSLKRIYLWNTKVSRELADSLQKENPALSIDLGFVLTEK
jgi:Leucine-rich repeat (LRR) protein